MLNPVIAAITCRATLGRRRALVFAVIPLILIAVTLVIRAGGTVGSSWPAAVLGELGFSVVLPLTALVIGASVLGAEIDDGSVIYLLATPVRRTEVILTKFAVAAGLSMAFAAVPELIAGLISPGGARLAFGLFAGALAGSVAYAALFVLASVLTSRAIALGLFYVLIWEGLLANFAGGARILSVGHYGLGIANAIAPDPGLHAGVGPVTSVVMATIVTALSLALTVRRLSAFTLAGDSE